MDKKENYYVLIERKTVTTVTYAVASLGPNKWQPSKLASVQKKQIISTETAEEIEMVDQIGPFASKQEAVDTLY